MESKKINQLATEMAPATSDLTIIGDPITGVSKKITLLQIADLFATTGTVTSVAVTETGDALTITGSPITSAGTINIGFAGDATQYVRGDGALADFPTSTGGGSSVSYYLNSSVSQGTIGGVAYRELSKDPIAGAGTDITISADGYIASYITDANDPALLEVPGGNFNCEFYFSVNSNAHNPYVYAELYKYDGTTFTLLGSSQSVPEYLTNGTTLSPYYFAVPVATAALTITDRLAIRIYANVDTRTVTLHTENNHLCQVVTTFSKGLTSLNNLTRQVQFLATGTSGTDFNIVSSVATHTFNIPDASATNRGLITIAAQTIAGAKVFDNPITGNSGIAFLNGVMPNITSNLYSGIGGNSQGISIITRPVSTNYTNNFYFPSASNSYTFPNATGTIALTSDISYPVTSVFGRTGAVVATSGDYTTTQVTEGTNLYFTDARARAALSAGTGISYNNGTGVITSTITQYTDALARAAISLTTTGTSGAATYNSTTGVFNIPQYTDQFVGTVTSVSALTIGTTGTNITSSVANSTTTPVITLNIPNSSATNRGALTAADWITFTNKQDALNGTGFVKAIGTDIFYDNSTYLTTSAAASTYLALAGGTLTGTLTGTNARFSGDATIGSTAAALSPLQVVATGTIVRLGEQSGTTGKQFLIGIDATSGRSELQSVWQGTSFTSLALQPSGGNVLIGTTGDNGARLEVKGGYTAFQYNSSATGPVYPSYNTYFGAIGTNFSNGGSELDIWNTVGGGFVFRRQTGASAQTALLTIASSGAASFSSSVNVGGTTITDGHLLNIVGSSATSNIGIVLNKTNSTAQIWGITNVGALTFYDYTAATERMRIGSNGNVGVGVANSSVTRLLVQGENTTASNFAFVATDSSATNLFFVRNDGYMYFGLAANSPYNIAQAGRSCILASNGSVGYLVSTRESKANIESIKNVDFINQLNPVQFNYRKKDDITNTFTDEVEENITYGFIADEVEKVNKDLVFYDNLKDGSKKLAGVEYNNMIAVLTKAVQELEARIKQLENK